MCTLLSQVQDDLRQLRENIVKGDGKTISIEELESALNKTEQGLQVRQCCIKEQVHKDNLPI